MAKIEVKDGNITDLSEEYQKMFADIHKMIVKGCIDEFKSDKYSYMNKQTWAKSMLDELLAMPNGKNSVGAVRVFRSGSKKRPRFKCVIQMTPKIPNTRNTENEEFFHGMIRNAHTSIHQIVRRKYDVSFECASIHGEPFEEFELWLKQKQAKKVWEAFEDKKTKPYKESVDEDEPEEMVVSLQDLPPQCQSFICDAHDKIYKSLKVKTEGDDEFNNALFGRNDLTINDDGDDTFAWMKTDYKSHLRNNNDGYESVGYTVLHKYGESYSGSIAITGEIPFGDSYNENADKIIESVFNECDNAFLKADSTKLLTVVGKPESPVFEFQLTPEYAKFLYQYMEANVHDPNLGMSDYFEDDESSPAADAANTSEGDNPFISIASPEELMDWMNDNIGTGYMDQHHKIHVLGERVSLKDALFAKAILQSPDELLKNKAGCPMDKVEFARKWFNDHNIKAAVLYLYLYQDAWYCAFTFAHPFLVYKNGESYNWFETGLGTLSGIQEYDTIEDVLSECTNKTKKWTGLKLAIPSLYWVNKTPEPGISANKYLIFAFKSPRIKFKIFSKNNATIKKVPEGMFESVFTEAGDNNGSNEGIAKRTLASVSDGVIKNLQKDSNWKITQYTANIYANVISKDLLPIWAHGYRKFSIVLDQDSTANIVEFKIPSMAKDFVARFVEGRETMNGFLHRNPEIKMKISPKVFSTMKNPNDAYRFFKAAIRYYDSGVSRYSDKLMANVMKLDKDTKYLISTTKLSGIVTLPIKMLFSFDKVDMTSTSIFKISNDDINAVNRFINSIYSHYASPEKEKNKILSDLQNVIKSFNEYVDHEFDDLPSVIREWYDGKFNKQLKEFDEKWIFENIDTQWEKNAYPQLKLLVEKTRVKKLKKIPRDLVAYITIETEAIRDENDKMMIASYCLSKIEVVEWYIELIDSGSKKYIVPHPRPYLVEVHTQLLACYKRIMATKIKDPRDDRPTLPPGYED